MGGYLTAVWRCRYFWLSLVRMDLRTRYRRSFLGMGWSLLHPIAMTAILTTVFHHLFHQEIRDYAPFLMLGLAFWNYIVYVSLQGSQCFLLGESYIRQYPAPMAIYPLRTTLGATIHFLITLVVALALTAYLRGPLTPAMLSLVPSGLLLFLFGWSLAVLAGSANVVFRDTQHLLEVGFQLLFYATPIFYSSQFLRDHNLEWLVTYNPLVPFLQLLREPVLDGVVPSALVYGQAAATTLGFLTVAGLTLVRLQRRLIFHL